MRRDNPRTPRIANLDQITVNEIHVLGDVDIDGDLDVGDEIVGRCAKLSECLEVAGGFDPTDEHYGYGHDYGDYGGDDYGYGFQYGTPPKQRGTLIDQDGIRTDAALVLDDSLHGILFRAFGGNYYQLRAEENDGIATLVWDGQYPEIFGDDDEPSQPNEKVISTIEN